MDLIATLQQQLQQLKQQALDIDAHATPGKPQNWFDSSVFSCRSSELCDYVKEAQRNLQHVKQAKLSDSARLRAVQHLAEQVSALTRAFRNVDVRRKVRSNKVNVKAVVQHVSASSQQLYQQLSDIQQFERRLLDMIAMANRDDTPAGVQRTLALHARLGRCRQALSDIERQIQDFERRN